MHLSPAEVQQFHRNGFLSPLRAFSSAETIDLRRQLETYEQQAISDGLVPRITDMHLTHQWAWDAVHDPRIVDPVSDVLGANVLLWSMNWFIKGADDGKFVTFHQDATYWGLEPHDVATAWIALSDATEKTGPMKFIVGSHKEEVREHQDTFEANNLLSRGQVINGTVDESRVVLAPLKAGEMSLHHVRTIHGSDPNRTSDRRIGMVLRYCATHVRQTKLRDTAVLVKGVDTFGNFDLLQGPDEDLGADEVDRQTDALRRMQRAIHSKDYE